MGRHWRVTVTFEDGFQHVSDWHAEKNKAGELVVQEAKIERERAGLGRYSSPIQGVAFLALD